VSGIKSRHFKSRCEGALDEIASVGGESSADGGGGLHSQGIIWWWGGV
jgi:hypothetical protein